MPGISAVKTMIPFSKKGISWQAYWATLISATVENAAPTHVVLTGLAPRADVTADLFTIAGFTISSASWTGAVFTLVVSRPVLVFDEDLTITFVKSGETGTVTNNVANDGNTVGWYDLDTDTITKSVAELISKWADKLGSGNDLLQASDIQKPLYTQDYVFFEKNARFVENVAIPALTQPTFIYMVVKQNNWTAGNGIFDGSALFNGACYQTVATPTIAIRAGAASAVAHNTDLAIGSWGIVRILFNGAGSKIQVNASAATTGNPGANDMGGIRLGSMAGYTVQSCIREAIFRANADDATTEAAIYNYLENKHAFFLTP